MELILKGTPEELSQFFKISETKIPNRIVITPKSDKKCEKKVVQKKEETTEEEPLLSFNECEKILRDEWHRLVPFVIAWIKKRGVNPDEDWVWEELKFMPAKKRHVLLSRAKAAIFPNRKMADRSPWGINAIAERLCISKRSVTSTRVDTINELAKEWQRKEKGNGARSR